MAKAQSATDLPKSPVSVQSIYRRVLEDLMPLAEAKYIDIGVEGTLDAEVWASELYMIAVCWRQFKIDHLCQLNFDQGSKAGFVVPGCG